MERPLNLLLPRELSAADERLVGDNAAPGDLPIWYAIVRLARRVEALERQLGARLQVTHSGKSTETAALKHNFETR